jgi:hypothetical protein
MKLHKILFCQVIRLLKISGAGSDGSIYGLNLARACQEKYGFLESPQRLIDYDLSKGITFLHGDFDGRFVVDKFQVFGNGILVEAKVSTDECEEFLDDVIAWVEQKGGIKIDDTERKSYYVSQVEVELANPLYQAFPKLRDIGQRVSETLRSYGHIIPNLELSGVAVSADPVAMFKIERREGVPPRPGIERLYFCAAPVRTSDHLRLLEVAEKVLFD